MFILHVLLYVYNGVFFKGLYPFRYIFKLLFFMKFLIFPRHSLFFFLKHAVEQGN